MERLRISLRVKTRPWSGSTGLRMTQYEITLMTVEGRLGRNARGDWKIRSEMIKMMWREMLKVA